MKIKPLLGPKKTNPIQSQFQMGHELVNRMKQKSDYSNILPPAINAKKSWLLTIDYW